jgi:hypothetical protein
MREIGIAIVAVVARHTLNCSSQVNKTPKPRQPKKSYDHSYFRQQSPSRGEWKCSGEWETGGGLGPARLFTFYFGD